MSQNFLSGVVPTAIDPRRWQQVKILNALNAATSGGGVDPEVSDWVTRVIANGGSVSASTQTAANTFMLALKAANIRTLILRLNLYAGTGLNAARTPFIKDYGPAVDVLTNFGAGNYSEATGLTGNGTTMYNDTGVVLTDLNDHGPDSVSYALYSRAPSAAAALDMGSFTSGSNFTYLSIADLGSTLFAMQDSNNQASAADAVGTGLYLGTRNSAVDMKIYRNGAQIATTATPGIGPVGINITRIYVHAANNGNANAFSFSSMVCGGYMMGNKFSAAQALALYTPWQAFQTALARQV